MIRDEYYYTCQQCIESRLASLGPPGHSRCGSAEWNGPGLCPEDDTSPVLIPVWNHNPNKQKVCEVHGVPLQLELSNVAYGLYDEDPTYLAEKNELFPHSNSWVLGGCMTSDVEVIEIDCCRMCRDAEGVWTQMKKTDQQ